MAIKKTGFTSNKVQVMKFEYYCEKCNTYKILSKCEDDQVICDICKEKMHIKNVDEEKDNKS